MQLRIQHLSKECLHVGNKGQDPRVMQSCQLVVQLKIQHPNKECLHVGNKEQDPRVMQSW
jgi:hypothetical protein